MLNIVVIFHVYIQTATATFRTWNALRIHLNRFHVIETRQKQFQNIYLVAIYVMWRGLNLEKDYWAH